MFVTHPEAEVDVVVVVTLIGRPHRPEQIRGHRESRNFAQQNFLISLNLAARVSNAAVYLLV